MADLFTVAAIIVGIIFILLLVGLYQKSTNEICTSKKRLDGKTVLVTGGTLGMGLEIAKDFAQRGARVIVACPFEDEGLQAEHTIIKVSGNKNVAFKNLNLASFESVRNFANDILKNEDRLDILVNNAGIGGPRSVTCDGHSLIMQVNYFGAFLLTLLLLPLLKKTGRLGDPSRIVNTSSVLHNFGTVNCNNLDAYKFELISYANSKLYVAMFTRELTKRLQSPIVVVNSVDPGAVGTQIFSTWNSYIGKLLPLFLQLFFKTPWQGAQTALHVALDTKAGEVSGEFFKNCKQSRAIGRVYNHKLAAKLWEESVRLVKLSNEEIDNSFKCS